MRDQSRPDVVDLFAGAGGLDEGARLAGATGRTVGIEIDEYAVATAEAAGHERVHGDVTEQATLPYRGVDGVKGSPPCPPFSRAGKHLGFADPRGRLVYEPLRWVEDLRPRWVLLEQVPRVLSIWEEVAAILTADGYMTWTGLVNAADHGVAQDRVRAVLLARRDAQPVPPAPQPRITLGEALGWPDGDYVGFPRHADTPRLIVIDGVAYRSRDLRSATRQAQTVTEKARSWTRFRADGGRERVDLADVATLQGFRRDYPWQGPRTRQFLQCANAVPPPLAAALLAPMVAPGAAPLELAA